MLIKTSHLVFRWRADRCGLTTEDNLLSSIIYCNILHLSNNDKPPFCKSKPWETTTWATLLPLVKEKKRYPVQIAWNKLGGLSSQNKVGPLFFLGKICFDSLHSLKFRHTNMTQKYITAHTFFILNLSTISDFIPVFIKKSTTWKIYVSLKLCIAAC